jgi:YggT family protein
VTSLIQAIRLISTGLTIIVFADIIIGYFLNPFHPLRRTLDGIVEPMLAPIRRVLPPIGMFDFSPLVLIILIEVIESLLIRLIT